MAGSILDTYILNGDSEEEDDEPWMLSGSDHYVNLDTQELISADEYERRKRRKNRSVGNDNFNLNGENNNVNPNQYSPNIPDPPVVPQYKSRYRDSVIKRKNPVRHSEVLNAKEPDIDPKKQIIKKDVLKNNLSSVERNTNGGDMDTSEDCSGKWDKVGIEKDNIDTEEKVINNEKNRNVIKTFYHGINRDIVEPHIDPWLDLVNMRHDESTYNELERRNDLLHLAPSALYKFEIQKIEDAWGTLLNLDYYSVLLTRLPYDKGKQLSAVELFDLIRKKLNYFLDADFAEISPYWVPEDEIRYASDDYVNSVMHFDMDDDPNLDDGSIIVSKQSEEYCIFTTITAPGDLQHPVSGNRKFGFVEKCDGTVRFYTRGVDRPTNLLDELASGTIFRGADALWTSHMKAIASFVNRTGGIARVGQKVLSRPPWGRLDKR